MNIGFDSDDKKNSRREGIVAAWKESEKKVMV